MTNKILLILLLFTTSASAEERLMLTFMWSQDTKTAIPDGFKATYYRNNVSGGFIAKNLLKRVKLYETAGIAHFEKQGFVEGGIAFSDKLDLYTAAGLISQGVTMGLNSIGKDYNIAIGGVRTFKETTIVGIKPKPIEHEYDDEKEGHHEDDHK